MTGKSIKIVYADSAIAVIEKPSGFLAVPGRGADKQDCAAKRLREMFPDCIEQPAVHRLDMDTSGLMVLALTIDAHRHLSRQFEQKLVEKRYIAVIDGVIENEGGRIELRFRLDPDNRPFQVYDPVHGKTGVTKWRKLSVQGGTTRIEFTPETGRTHQLRLHSAHELGLGFPIVGDRLYGRGINTGELKLHASFLRFCHPGTVCKMAFESSPNF